MAVRSYKMDQRLLRNRAKTILETKPSIYFQSEVGCFDQFSAPCVDASRVVDWISVRGGVSVSQATSTKNPTWLQYGIGQSNALAFDGGDYLPLGSAAAVAADTVGMVQIVFEQSVTAGEQCMLSVYDNAVTAKVVSFSLTGGKLLLVHQSGAGQPVGIVTGNTSVGTGPRVATYICDEDAPGGWRLFLDDTLQTLTPSSDGNIGKWFGAVGTIGALAIGCERSSGTSPFKGKIASVGIWSRVL